MGDVTVCENANLEAGMPGHGRRLRWCSSPPPADLTPLASLTISLRRPRLLGQPVADPVQITFWPANSETTWVRVHLPGMMPRSRSADSISARVRGWPLSFSN
jgi:hypothetical protein